VWLCNIHSSLKNNSCCLVEIWLDWFKKSRGFTFRTLWHGFQGEMNEPQGFESIDLRRRIGEGFTSANPCDISRGEIDEPSGNAVRRRITVAAAGVWTSCKRKSHTTSLPPASTPSCLAMNTMDGGVRNEKKKKKKTMLPISRSHGWRDESLGLPLTG
jgi:hypothetical protein